MAKLISMNVCYKWTCRKRSMNVNNRLNIIEFIAELLRGDVRKRDHDGGGGHLEKGALTSAEN